MAAIFEPGFFSSPPVRLALLVGGLVALATAAVGVLTVMRRQAFAGEALGDVGAAGGSGALLTGIAPLWGFLGLALAAAGAMEFLGVQRARGREVATGVVLGAGFGLAALFLYLAATDSSATGATGSVLFGSIFTLSDATLPLVAVLTGLTLTIVLGLHRPLLLASLSPELAAARGLPVRLLGALYLGALALAVALAAITIGAILSTALIVGPAAIALALTAHPLRATVLAALIGLAAVWAGILLAYDSFYWPPLHHGWPVSFFVVVLILAGYLATRRRR